MLTTRKDFIHFCLWVVQPTMILGRTAHQHCCTPYDTYYRLITNVYVCNVNIALHTMARLDDEYQDLEEVII